MGQRSERDESGPRDSAEHERRAVSRRRALDACDNTVEVVDRDAARAVVVACCEESETKLFDFPRTHLTALDRDRTEASEKRS